MAANPLVSVEEALQFALMISSGMPPMEAICYFYPEQPPDTLNLILKSWMGSKEVSRALLDIQGAPWQDLDLAARVAFAVDKAYSEMAYYIYSHNYVLLNGDQKSKYETCLKSLEAKLAGTAGKTNPLSDWWNDVRTGKVKLAS